jgi:hypothetical protein
MRWTQHEHGEGRALGEWGARAAGVGGAQRMRSASQTACYPGAILTR